MNALPKTTVIGCLAMLCQCLLAVESYGALEPSELLFLDRLSRDTFNYFWQLSSSPTFQTPDRWPVTSNSFSSIAATGFGLAAYIIGSERGYVTREQSAERVHAVLKTLSDVPKGPGRQGVGGYRGFFYHFLNLTTATRVDQVELSTVDTALLMAGVLCTMEYYREDNAVEAQIRKMADQLYRAVEWDWAMNGRPTMSMGYTPESGFLDATWQGYNEGSIIYILAIGSPTHPIPPRSWTEWTKTFSWGTFQGEEFVNFGPLFAHQYSQMFIDFRGIQDDYMRQKGIDYHINSRRATYANRRYAISNPAGYIGYDENVWGITACDGPHYNASDKPAPNSRFVDGYDARGVGLRYLNDDGTISPTAAGGSVAFSPEICVPALMTMNATYGEKLYGPFGLKDAFNPSYVYVDSGDFWIDTDYVGIDQGPILIQIDNLGYETIWKLLKQNSYIKDGLTRAGFTSKHDNSLYRLSRYFM